MRVMVQSLTGVYRNVWYGLERIWVFSTQSKETPVDRMGLPGFFSRGIWLCFMQIITFWQVLFIKVTFSKWHFVHTVLRNNWHHRRLVQMIRSFLSVFVTAFKNCSNNVVSIAIDRRTWLQLFFLLLLVPWQEVGQFVCCQTSRHTHPEYCCRMMFISRFYWITDLIHK